MLLVATDVVAQQQVDAPPTLQDVKDSLGQTIDVMVWPFAFLAKAWWVLSRYTSAAILLSAASAGLFAYLSMRRQAETARVKETFTIINRDNWDEDVIEARKDLRRILNALAVSGGSVSKYAEDTHSKAQAEIDLRRSPSGAHVSEVMPATSGEQLSPADQFIKEKITLNTIMNHYENLALGVKYGILDETFLFQYMRATALGDWNHLSPLVYEYRQQDRNPQLYIEFEGLASQWARDRSYKKGRKTLKKSTRKLWIK